MSNENTEPDPEPSPEELKKLERLMFKNPRENRNSDKRFLMPDDEPADDRILRDRAYLTRLQTYINKVFDSHLPKISEDESLARRKLNELLFDRSSNILLNEPLEISPGDLDYLRRLQSHVNATFNKLVDHLQLNRRNQRFLFRYIFNTSGHGPFSRFVAHEEAYIQMLKDTGDPNGELPIFDDLDDHE